MADVKKPARSGNCKPVSPTRRKWDAQKTLDVGARIARRRDLTHATILELEFRPKERAKVQK
jgi:hypothetical protein